MADDHRTLLTENALAKLREEYERLTTEGRRYMEERIAEARSHGDLRENADYDAAKNEQGLMEARIRQLRHILDTAEIIQAADEDIDTVIVGTVVTVVDDDGDEMELLVAPKENKVPGLLLASPDSPLGGALLGARAGDQVTYQAPAGTFSYTVASIRPFEG